MNQADDVLGEVKRFLAGNGLAVQSAPRIPNDTGTALKLRDGRTVSVHDNGRVYVQGGKQPERVRELQRSLDEHLQGVGPRPLTSRKVFVVYGHDTKAKMELENLLRRWHLEPLILDQLPSKGQTIIEKIEHYRGQAEFAVVLATPDDEGHVAHRPDERLYRARQNVVLELGMLLAMLGRSRVAILLKNTVEMERPSDIQGLIYFPFSEHVAEVSVPLAKEMNGQGLSIDLDRL